MENLFQYATVKPGALHFALGDFEFDIPLSTARILLDQLHEQIAAMEVSGEALSVTPANP